jgi:hypothetical protein
MILLIKSRTAQFRKAKNHNIKHTPTAQAQLIGEEPRFEVVPSNRYSALTFSLLPAYLDQPTLGFQQLFAKNPSRAVTECAATAYNQEKGSAGRQETDS